MSSSGGEILRAVLEKSSVFSAPAFYCITLNGVDGTANAHGFQRGFLQLHKDRWFLVTSIIPTATTGNGGVLVGFGRMDSPEFVRLFDPANDGDYASSPLQMHASLYADTNLANAFTLPEYLLWEPGSLIGVEWRGVNWNSGVPNYKFLTLVGIEYGMKEP